MRPRIAIPLPHFSDPKYAERAIPQYERAVELAGGEAVRIPLGRTTAEVSKMIETCQAVLLPGSKADVDPARFHAERSPKTAAADPRRDEVDNLLLDDAYRLHKPVLAICYGLQSLNVYRGGSLVQHIPDFLPEQARARVNHEAGGKVAVAHSVEIEMNSNLGGIVNSEAARAPQRRAWIATLKAMRHPKLAAQSRARAEEVRRAQAERKESDGRLIMPVNSSHHQSADAVGSGLRIVARCPDDGIVEGLESTHPDHFVLAVQWHPERSVDEDEASRAIFHALTEEASKIEPGLG
jgi:putative glutamine amidotransferase